MASWIPPHFDHQFVPLADMNKDADKYILTEQERKNGDVYPHPDIQLGCLVQGFYHRCLILERESASNPDLSRLDKNDMERRKSMYKVRIRKWGRKTHSFDVSYFWPFGPEKYKDIEVSASEVRFFAGQYGSDQFLPKAFRHHIGVPKGLWPRQWLNRKEQT